MQQLTLKQYTWINTDQSKNTYILLNEINTCINEGPYISGCLSVSMHSGTFTWPSFNIDPNLNLFISLTLKASGGL